MPLNIIARKKRDPMGSSEFVVVDRGQGYDNPHDCRYVSATVSPESLEHDEWFWGHYFQTLDGAMYHFNNR